MFMKFKNLLDKLFKHRKAITALQCKGVNGIAIVCKLLHYSRKMNVFFTCEIGKYVIQAINMKSRFR